MAILYKTFMPIRTVFLAFLLVFLAFAPMAMAAGNPLFTVEGIEVDVTADSALAARNEAFSKAQQDAYKKLLEQILPASEASQAVVPEAKVIAPMIQDYEITREKLSSVRYIGTYTFRFKEKSVRRYLSLYEGQSGPELVSSGGRPLLILPFYEASSVPALWTGPNLWFEAWARSADMGGMVTMVLPIGDLQDVKDIDDGQALTYDERALASMVQRYQAGEAVIALATPDSSLRLASSNAARASGTLSINIYRTDRGLAELVRTLSVYARPEETIAQVLDRAVLSVQQVLRRDWKQLNQDSAFVPPQEQVAQEAVYEPTPVMQQGQMIMARVPFGSFKEWSSTQKSLRRVSGFRDMTIRALSPREAYVEISYAGNATSLDAAFKQVGLLLQPDPIKPSGYAIFPMQRAVLASPAASTPPSASVVPASPPRAPLQQYQQNF